MATIDRGSNERGIDDGLAGLLASVEARTAEALHMKKQERGLTHFTMTDACREAGECERTMWRVTSRGNPTLRTLVRLAKTLDVRVEWLLGGNGVEWDAWR